MNFTPRNFHAHGGNEWVIGGKLTFLPGAQVEGLLGILDITPEGIAQMDYQKPSEASTVAALREDLNLLLAKFKEVGLMVGEAPPEEEPPTP